MVSLLKQRGTAIIMALFVMSLVAAIATAMMWRMSIEVKRTTLLANDTQAYLYAAGSVNWAIDQLNNNFLHQQSNQVIDHLPLQSTPANKNGFEIASTIQDAQALFNLNNLTNPDDSAIFFKLIKQVAPTLDDNVAKNIVNATRNWISPTDITTSNEKYYAKQEQPYRTPHRPMTSVSELRLVQGMTADLYQKLSPYIIALPAPTTININTVSVPVLIASSASLSLEPAKAIHDYCQNIPFISVDKFLNFDIVKNNSTFPQDKLTVTSNYFLVTTSVKVGEQKLLLQTLLQRTLKDNKPIITILWQTRGTL